ncbi:hypothetical protein SAMN05444161_4475 [Rhizobiales bacterium GAS191]|nr:hypothetical protein SAMN05519103_03768 [Rhizobiales bacterium GAS113]SED95401.1 hypothetical protein SAMN05444161_4475 [Rhizobiales bacterium GAS191]SEE52665.1 hypothetical protein SAMN05519104_6396 [Rhizobiales bacterium GAS188]
MKRILPHLLAAFALSFALLGLAPGAAALAPQSVLEWLHDVYAAEAARIAHGQSLSDAEFLALLTPQTAKLWREAREHPTPDLPEGPTLNAFFGWGVAPGSKVAFVGAAVVLGTVDAPVVLVDLMVKELPRRVVVDVVEDARSWRIANIVYDAGDDFVSFEKRLARH